MAFLANTTLEAGEGLALEPIEPCHAEALFELVEENRAYLREWLPWVDAHASLVDTLDFIHRSRDQRASGNGLTLALIHEGRLIGVIGHNSIDWGNRNCQIGYWLSAAMQGGGRMTRACRAVVNHAFHELKMQRVEIRCATGNTRSRAIPERLGFVQEGVLRQAGWHYGQYLDLAVYAALVDEWSASYTSSAPGVAAPGA